MDPLQRNTTKASKFDHRVNETAADSNVGETVTPDGFHVAHYLMDIDWLKEAYRRTRKDGAVGVDGQTAEEYEQDLEENLQSLLDRAKSGTYGHPCAAGAYSQGRLQHGNPPDRNSHAGG